MNSVFIAEAVATRLSHDLIGNIGAVANAVELLNEGDDDDKDDITNILNFSSDVLSKRLKFFRLCFGLSNAKVKDLAELESITSAYLSTLGNPSLPTTLRLNVTTPEVYKIVMPSVMMMADTLIKGGEIVVNQTDTSLEISATSNAPLNTGKLANITRVLQHEEVDENPSTYAPLFYLLAYLGKSGVSVRLNQQTLVIGD